MKINRIKIRDLRAIGNLELDVMAGGRRPLDLVVLAGPNGCGKTSVLEACLWALNQDVLVPRALPQQDYLIELDITHEGEQYSISRSPKTHVVHSANGEVHRFPKKGLPAELRLRSLYFSSWRAPRLIGSVPLSTGKGKRPQRTPQNALWRLKQYLVNLTGGSAIPGFEKVRPVKAPELLDRIMDLWREFYPGTQSYFEIGVIAGQEVHAAADDADEDANDELAFDLFLIDSGHRQRIAVDELSAGEIEVLSMIGAFLLERSPYDLILIDEPELHLHPAWHRAIIRVLRRALPNSQLICATHSEHILDAVYSYERFTLLDANDPRLRLVGQEAFGSA
jgi:energy-coupling factor transporter ATP-binding protein EcfA2